MKIKRVYGLEVLDSRGNPTVKGYIELENGLTGSAIIPSGASTGSHEALELRDNETARYQGKGVQQAIKNINGPINSRVKGMDIENLDDIDGAIIELDGTANKSRLGANAVLAVSLAAARALALSQNQPLWKTLHDVYFPHKATSFPRLMINVINGGAHADWTLDFQEFMISPKASKPSESVRIGSEIFHTLKEILKKDGHIVSVGDEGGFAPKLESNDQAFEYISKAISEAGHSRETVDLATDVAASEFYKDGKYHLYKEGNASLTSDELRAFYEDLLTKHDIMSFEDPFHEDDWDSFKAFTAKQGQHTLVVGDDLYVTNMQRIHKGIEMKASNAVLIKVNQIGSLLETVQAINATLKAGWTSVISHRSGETEDSLIADLAYASGSQFIKTGSMSRSDRLAKYNRLLEIEAFET